MTRNMQTGYPSMDKPWLKFYTDEITRISMPDCSIYEYLWKNNKDHPDDIALNYFDNKISYGEMFDEIDRAAKAFTALGVKEGDIVTFAALSCPETVFSFYALNKIGAVPNMVNVLSSADDFKRYINEVESNIFVCWNVFFDTASQKLKETTAKKVIVIEPGNYLPGIKKLLFKLKKSPKINYNNTVLNWNDFIKLDAFLTSHHSKALIHNGYGMTEVCASAICAWDYAIREGSIGIPMPYNNVKIVEPETDRELGYGEIGEVCISSPSVMLGYYKNEGATNDLIRTHSDGCKWVHSGDLGYIDEDGFVFLTGRIRRIILTSYTEIPSKIFPDQIEKVILKHPAVFQCCVVSDPHPKYKFVTKAHIVLKDGFTNQEELKSQIESLCKENLPDYSIPFSYCFRSELPLTAVGKVDWRKLEEEVQ